MKNFMSRARANLNLPPAQGNLKHVGGSSGLKRSSRPDDDRIPVVNVEGLQPEEAVKKLVTSNQQLMVRLKRLVEVEEENDHLTTRTEMLKADLDTAARAYSEERASLLAKMQAMQAVAEELRQRAAETGPLREQVQELEYKLMMSSAGRTTSPARSGAAGLAEAQRLVQKLEGENHKLREELETMEDYSQDLRAQLEQARREGGGGSVGSMQQELKAAKQEVERLRWQVDELAAAEEASEKLEREVRALRRERDSLSLQLQERVAAANDGWGDWSEEDALAGGATTGHGGDGSSQHQQQQLLLLQEERDDARAQELRQMRQMYEQAKAEVEHLRQERGQLLQQQEQQQGFRATAGPQLRQAKEAVGTSSNDWGETDGWGGWDDDDANLSAALADEDRAAPLAGAVERPVAEPPKAAAGSSDDGDVARLRAALAAAQEERERLQQQLESAGAMLQSSRSELDALSQEVQTARLEALSWQGRHAELMMQRDELAADAGEAGCSQDNGSEAAAEKEGEKLEAAAKVQLYCKLEALKEACASFSQVVAHCDYKQMELGRAWAEVMQLTMPRGIVKSPSPLSTPRNSPSPVLPHSVDTALAWRMPEGLRGRGDARPCTVTPNPVFDSCGEGDSARVSRASSPWPPPDSLHLDDAAASGFLARLNQLCSHLAIAADHSAACTGDDGAADPRHLEACTSLEQLRQEADALLPEAHEEVQSLQERLRAAEKELENVREVGQQQQVELALQREMKQQVWSCQPERLAEGAEMREGPIRTEQQNHGLEAELPRAEGGSATPSSPPSHEAAGQTHAASAHTWAATPELQELEALVEQHAKSAQEAGQARAEVAGRLVETEAALDVSRAGQQAAEQQLQQASSELRSVQECLTAAENRESTLKETCSQLQQQRASLAAEAQSLRLQVETQQAHLQEQQQQLASSAAARTTTETELEALQQQLEELKLQRSQEQRQSAQLQASMERLQEELQRSLAVQEGGGAADAEVQQLLRERAEAEERERSVRERCDGLQARATELEAQLEERAESLKQARECAEAAEAGKDEEGRQLAHAHARAVDAERVRDELVVQLGQLKQYREALEQSFKATQEQLEAEQRERRQEGERREEEAAATAERLDLLQKVNKKSRGEVEELQARVTSSQAETRAAEEELEQVRQELNAQSAANGELHLEMRALRSRAAVLASLQTALQEAAAASAGSAKAPDPGKAAAAAGAEAAGSSGSDAAAEEMAGGSQEADAGDDLVTRLRKMVEASEQCTTLQQSLTELRQELAEAQAATAAAEAKAEAMAAEADDLASAVGKERERARELAVAFERELDQLQGSARSHWPAQVRLLVEQHESVAAAGAAEAAARENGAVVSMLESDLKAARDSGDGAQRQLAIERDSAVALQQRLAQVQGELRGRERALKEQLEEQQVRHEQRLEQMRTEMLRAGASRASSPVQGVDAGQPAAPAQAEAARMELEAVRQRAHALMQEKDEHIVRLQQQLRAAQSTAHTAPASPLPAAAADPAEVVPPHPAQPSSVALQAAAASAEPDSRAAAAASNGCSPSAGPAEAAPETGAVSDPPCEQRQASGDGMRMDSLALMDLQHWREHCMALEQEVEQLKEALADAEHTHQLRDTAQDVLKEEIAQLRRREYRRTDLDVEYLKTVLVNALESRELVAGSKMLQVLCRLLQLSPQELERIAGGRTGAVARSPKARSSTGVSFLTSSMLTLSSKAAPNQP